MQRALEAESERWSSMSAEQLIVELPEPRNYQIAVGAQRYQCEVQLLENTETYIHVAVGLDDGRLPYSIVPMSYSFIRTKAGHPG